MILTKNKDTGWYTEGPDGSYLSHVHDKRACDGSGCAVHDHPTEHALSEAPLNWREDRNILERICKHGVGHPDYDSALYLESIGQSVKNIHGCDGCCWTKTER